MALQWISNPAVEAPEPGASPAELALLAFKQVALPAAILGRQGQLLLANEAFTASLDSKDALSRLRALTGAFQCSGEHHRSHHLGLSDGRTFCVDLAALPMGSLVTAHNVTSGPERQHDASRAALTDDLTGLPNRSWLRERLRNFAQASDNEPAEMALLAINLDRFNAVNEALGHETGNVLLKTVADRIRSILEEGDFAARIGDDEFAILIARGEQPRTADNLAMRLVDLLGRSYLVEGHLINISASIGIALASNAKTDAEPLLKKAILAMSRIKCTKPGSYCFYKDAMQQRIVERRALELDLRHALALREFELVYQPQCHLGSRQIRGFEALLRWHSAGRGVVSPLDFIPLAEEIGLILPIGDWVLRTACREAASWHKPYGIAVNVSAAQIARPGFVQQVISALAASGLAPSRLELEITESIFIGDNEAALATLRQVKELGVRISMDDFGTGYSSLSYLRSFPFDALKIDQSFVHAMLQDGSGMAIVRAAASLGRSLRMATIAEGVETTEQLQHLVEAGCTQAQGYLISRPLPSANIAAFLADYAPQGAKEADPASTPEADEAP
ncbi:putative bifunctional diguanylate cyclase/phosphodiesterase [Afifella pfennigii]|uniref:putative bifunctional diguanylate cyclase/phosphodiesterase n=1 Tax=Afifella pfennigii TaxID=209897 RepID=UPI00068E1D1B|nr:bifunctional diguanylate cyclase/phosphodiesterase [Afifella pfennigii]